MFYRFHVNLFGPPFSITWEQAATALQNLSQMLFEPDGSWIWSGDSAEGKRWHINGHLFDFDGRLHRVELHGECPAAALDQLLACFGWPETKLTYEQVREGITVQEEEFRKNASCR